MLTRTICHLYGPWAIHSYGLFICIGIITIQALLYYDKKRAALIDFPLLVHCMAIGTWIGIIGGRALHCLTSYQHLQHWYHILYFHEGGFSILGAVLAILAIMPWYVRRYHIDFLTTIDLVVVYAPLLQAISRIGCFFAGCCYGAPSTYAWAVMYQSTDTVAPRLCSLHPTQLYSVIALIIIYAFLCTIRSYRFAPGQLTCIYLILFSMQRFCIDIWRGDREYITCADIPVSVHQALAFTIMLTALSAYFYFNRRTTHDQYIYKH